TLRSVRFLTSNYVVLFFFSSRRRHTRSLRDWSSDVCSSDLATEWCTSPARSMNTTPWPVGLPPSSRARFILFGGINILLPFVIEIGRASCRERVEISGGAGPVKKTRNTG